MTDTGTTEHTSHGPEAEQQDVNGHGAAARDAGDQPAHEFDELTPTRQDVAQRARRLVAGDLASRAADGADDERAGRLVAATRTGLRAELREQEQARRLLGRATRSGEDAVAGVVQGTTTIVRSIVPAVLVRPEDVIEATDGLADQGLRVSRRPARTVAGSSRDPTPAA